jgi:hypothetical protein
MSLADRGYVAGVHPLELWLAEFLHRHPGATLAQAVAESVEERQEVYRWLFATRSKRAQDRRIRTLLEVEAFLEIHRRWRRAGYPFDSLVPSLATAIGTSADRPDALAELIGIVLAGGVRYPVPRIVELRFAEETPYETRLARRVEPGRRVMAPDVAAVLRRALVGVVEEGTGRGAWQSVRPAVGAPPQIGGRGGRLLESRAVNRTATFAFFIGDRFFGTITAYVPGQRAGEYRFTSALAIDAFNQIAPALVPLFEPREPAIPELRADDDYPESPGQRAAQSSDVSKLLPLPPQPPHVKRSQRPDSPS